MVHDLSVAVSGECSGDCSYVKLYRQSSGGLNVKAAFQQRIQQEREQMNPSIVNHRVVLILQ